MTDFRTVNALDYADCILTKRPIIVLSAVYNYFFSGSKIIILLLYTMINKEDVTFKLVHFIHGFLFIR